MQLCAQALCLEIMLVQDIPAGALYYGATRRRTEVLFDDELRRLTRDTIDAVRAMLGSQTTPSAQYSPRLCDACSLLDLCQPKLLGRRQSVSQWLSTQWRHDDPPESEPCAGN